MNETKKAKPEVQEKQIKTKMAAVDKKLKFSFFFLFLFLFLSYNWCTF